MTDSWVELTAAEQELTARLFVALSLGEELHRKAGERGTPRLTAATVFALARSPHHPLDAEMRAALAASAPLGELFNALVRRDALAFFPRAAAAAGGESVDRQLADGFRIRLIPSRSTAGQSYVIIDLPSGQDWEDCSLFILRDGVAPQKTPLPKPMRGQIQLLCESDSDLAAGLRDPAAEVLLR